jgi:hypothetical protein
MKKNQIILFLLATVISSFSFGQPSKYPAIVPMENVIPVHQQRLSSEDGILLNKIDSVNHSQLKRTSKLDDAAKHHAMYLVNQWIDSGQIGHGEDLDYPGIEKKPRITDRIGEYEGSHKYGEICSVYGDIETYRGEPNVQGIYKEVGGNWTGEHLTDMTDLKENFYFEGYKNSPKHWEIINDSDYKYFGSYTIFVCVYTKRANNWFRKGLRKAIEKKVSSPQKVEEALEELTGGNTDYVKCAINVVVFSSIE